MNEKLVIGNLGEKYFSLLLAKNKIDTIKLPSHFSCDFICSNGLRIEIKTSRVHIEKPHKNNKLNYSREYWIFNFNKGQNLRNNDYCILVCLNNKLNVEKLYLIPKEICKKHKILSVPRYPKQKSYNGFSLSKFKINPSDAIQNIMEKGL